MHSMELYENKSIFVALTYRCTAHCKKCITRYHKYVNQSMKIDTMTNVISFLERMNYKGMINLGSGEPLSYPYISSFITNLLAINDSLKIRLLSNGKLFSRSNVKNEWFNGRIIFGITLDGMYNDEIANLQNGIDIEKVKEQITDICNTYGSGNIYLNYTLNQQNKKSITDFLLFAKSNNIDSVYITNTIKMDGISEDIDNVIIQDSELVGIADEAKILAKAHKIKNFIITDPSQKAKWYCWKKRQANPIIELDGNITFCSGREATFIGRIDDVDVIDKWRKIQDELENNETIRSAAGSGTKAYRPAGRSGRG